MQAAGLQEPRTSLQTWQVLTQNIVGRPRYALREAQSADPSLTRLNKLEKLEAAYHTYF
jgi:hypothetical protein